MKGEDKKEGKEASGNKYRDAILEAAGQDEGIDIDSLSKELEASLSGGEPYGLEDEEDSDVDLNALDAMIAQFGPNNIMSRASAKDLEAAYNYFSKHYDVAVPKGEFMRRMLVDGYGTTDGGRINNFILDCFDLNDPSGDDDGFSAASNEAQLQRDIYTWLGLSNYDDPLQMEMSENRILSHESSEEDEVAPDAVEADAYDYADEGVPEEYLEEELEEETVPSDERLKDGKKKKGKGKKEKGKGSCDGDTQKNITDALLDWRF